MTLGSVVFEVLVPEDRMLLTGDTATIHWNDQWALIAPCTKGSTGKKRSHCLEGIIKPEHQEERGPLLHTGRGEVT